MTDFKDLGSVIKSPLDSNSYKVIRCPNEFRAILISRCDHIQEGKLDKETCTFLSIQEFNEKYLDIPRNKAVTSDGKNDEGPCSKKAKSNTNTNTLDTSEFKCAKRDRGEGYERVTVVLVIGSGHLSDPQDFSGIAHLTEHCVTLGSQKYPKVEHLSNFCKQYGGDANGGTNAETTSYSFTLEDTEHLEEALDILSDVIFHPRLKPEQVVAEIESLNSEFYSKKLNDDFRYLSLLLSFLNKEHPFGRYSIGSRETLSFKQDQLPETVAKWRENNYKPNNMTISIESPLSLDKMADMVVKTFGSKLKEISSPRVELLNKFKNTPLKCPRNNMWNTLIHLTPMTHGQWIKLAWILPPPDPLEYRTKPLQFLNYLLTSKGPGGLELYLKNQSYILNLSTCCSPISPEWGFCSTIFGKIFFITLQLTRLGLEKKDEVIKAIFSYFEMVKNSKEKDLKRVYDEMKQTSADMFHYRSDRNLLYLDPINKIIFDPSLSEDVENHVAILEALSHGILDGVDPPEVLTSQLIIRKFDFKLIKTYLESLLPKETNFMLASKDLESGCIEVESFFKTKYLSTPLDPKFMSELEKNQLEFKLPLPNECVKTTLCYLLKGPFEERKEIVKNDVLSVIYSNTSCREGYLPTAFCTMTLMSALALDSVIYGFIPTMEIVTMSLSYLLQLKIGSVLKALVDCQIVFDNLSKMLTFIITLPSSQLTTIFETVCDLWRNFETELKESILKNMVEARINLYEDVVFYSEAFAEDLKLSLLTRERFMALEQKQFLRVTSFSEFIEFIKTFKELVYISIELFGCVSKSDGDKIATIAKNITTSPWNFTKDLIRLNRAVKLPLGERCLRLWANNQLENNNLVVNHYQVGINEKKTRTILTGIEQSMNDAAFEYLRTKLQIGYFVELTIESYHSKMGITIKINGPTDKFTPHYIDDEVNNFLCDYFLSTISKQSEYDKEIGVYMDDEINWEDVKKLFLNYLLPEGSEFRKISIQIAGYPEDCKLKPKQGNRLKMLIKKYASGIPYKGNEGDPLYPFKLDIPRMVKDENGYFITNLTKFKEANMD